MASDEALHEQGIGRRGAVRTIVAGTAAAVGLVAGRNRRAAAQQPGQPIEGSWSWTATVAGRPPSLGFDSFSAAGAVTVIGNNPLVSVGSGSWIQTGDRQFRYTFLRHVWDEMRAYVGQNKTTASIELNPELDGFTGRFKSTRFDLSGAAVTSTEGTIEARRIRAELLE